MARLSELVDDFQARYARCIDDGDLTEWPAFFEERCRYRITSADNFRDGLEGGMIWANSRAMLVDRITALRQANIYERHSYRHLLGRSLIVQELDGSMQTETSFIVVRVTRGGVSELFASGRYIDEFLLQQNTLRLRVRDVICDSSNIDTLLAIPL